MYEIGHLTVINCNKRGNNLKKKFGCLNQDNHSNNRGNIWYIIHRHIFLLDWNSSSFGYAIEYAEFKNKR